MSCDSQTSACLTRSRHEWCDKTVFIQLVSSTHPLSFDRLPCQPDMSSTDGLEQTQTTQSELRIIGLGVIFSAMLYGVVATLALTYIPLLLNTSHTISRRMRNFLLAYVTFMVTASTVDMITLIVAFTIGHGIFNNGSQAVNGLDLVTFPNGLAGALCVTFASWGADGFMVSILKQRLDCCRPFISILLAMAVCGVI